MRRSSSLAAEAEHLTRCSRLFVLTGFIACALLVVLEDPLRGWIFAGLSTSGVVGGSVAVWKRRPPRSDPVWLFLLAAAPLVPAYVLWYPAQLQWNIPLGDPGPTDWLFLSSYATFIVALVRMVRRRSSAERRIHVLDTLIISVGLGVLVWVLFISPYLHDDGLLLAAKVVATSYTLIDLLLFGAVARMVVQGGIVSRGDRLLASWIAAQLLADLVYTVTSLRGTFGLAGPSPVLYAVSFVLLGAALLDPTTTRQPELSRVDEPMSGPRRLAIVAPAAFLAPVVLVVLGLKGNSKDVPVVALLAAVIFGLVFRRVWLLMADVQQHRYIQSQLTAAIDQERGQARKNQELLASLRERQKLSDRLFRIQRKISTRAPLQEVLDAVTAGAAELLGDEVVGLRLINEEKPDQLTLVSHLGVPEDEVAELEHSPVGAGVGGRALKEDRLYIQESYPTWEGGIPVFANGGLTAAMAAPVHLEGRPTGSLVVATRRLGRTYSVAEQDALVSFAEHVSIALNDARLVATMDRTLGQAVHQAMHDELTGLPNRACFYDRTDQALHSAHRSGSSTAVLLLDLNRFKEINDTLGHRYGDRVLQAIGTRLAPQLREPDTLARLGGDEFCVLLPDVGDVGAAVEVARRLLAALEQPFMVDGMTMVVEASCGVSVAPIHGDTADLLLQRADIAMYEAKNSQAGVVAYDDGLDRNSTERLKLFGDLRTGIASDQLVLHYQPQADMRTGVVEGVEALVRWDHPRLGLLGPDAFIPIAEETGLIRPLTSWVLDAALTQLRRWMDDPAFDTGTPMWVAVNLSTRSFLRDGLAEEVVLALLTSGVPSEHLILEITETAIMADPDRARSVLRELVDLGVRFAIDDFGTGYSSLASLTALPVQHLKIDQSFVRAVGGDANGATIVRSVIDLGHTLGLRTVAEGVESHETWGVLAGLGCDAAQGYALARPMDPDGLADWVEDHRRAQADWVAR